MPGRLNDSRRNDCKKQNAYLRHNCSQNASPRNVLFIRHVAHKKYFKGGVLKPLSLLMERLLTHTHSHTDTHTYRHTDTQTHTHTDTHTDAQTDTQTHRHIQRHTDTQLY